MGQFARIAQRYKTLLKLNEVALTQSTVDDLFQGMCASLRTLLDYNRAALTLYDPARDSLRIVALYGPYPNSVFQVGHFLPIKSSQDGWTFDHQMGIVRHDLAKDLRTSATHLTGIALPKAIDLCARFL